MNDTTPAKILLRDILERFPQADPESEFYNGEIDGCEAVNYISELIPEIRLLLDTDADPAPAPDNDAITALRAAWTFIEDVTDEDPERNDKFFALRVQVRSVLWNLDALKPAAPAEYRTSWNFDVDGKHEFFDVLDWRSDVAATGTVRGYQAWVVYQLTTLLHNTILDDVDGLEIAGCTDADGIVDVINETDAEFFSVYTHRQGEGVECICDFNTKTQAIEFAWALAARTGISVIGNLCAIG
ncbi:MAG: hypothetical protein J0653_08260 [Deltaproteobacteria bacterium]|nr:hypothetical protein [Deltaproteobacteria bacterium]